MVEGKKGEPPVWGTGGSEGGGRELRARDRMPTRGAGRAVLDQIENSTYVLYVQEGRDWLIRVSPRLRALSRC